MRKRSVEVGNSGWGRSVIRSATVESGWRSPAGGVTWNLEGAVDWTLKVMMSVWWSDRTWISVRHLIIGLNSIRISSSMISTSFAILPTMVENSEMWVCIDRFRATLSLSLSFYLSFSCSVSYFMACIWASFSLLLQRYIEWYWKKKIWFVYYYHKIGGKIVWIEINGFGQMDGPHWTMNA